MKRKKVLLFASLMALCLLVCACGNSKDGPGDETVKATGNLIASSENATTAAFEAVSTNEPTAEPTSAPTTAPATKPSAVATKTPTTAPATKPATTATRKPTTAPVTVPTKAPETKPVTAPTKAPDPTTVPTKAPATTPTVAPTKAPTTATTSKCDHSSTEWVIDKDATCIAEGKKYKVCIDCKTALEDGVINITEHSYSNYKCTACGEFQQDGLSGYLSDWVQKNGKVNGETVSLDFYIDDILYGFTYNATGEYFYFSLLDKNYNDFLSLKFAETAGIYELAYIQGTEPNTRTVFGKIEASKFTENTPITVEEYLGSSDGRPGAVENCRICTGLLLEAIETALDKYNVGLTLNDLGFSKLN